MLLLDSYISKLMDDNDSFSAFLGKSYVDTTLIINSYLQKILYLEVGKKNMSKHYVETIGTVIRVAAGQAISDATSLSFVVRKPSGKRITWVAELGPADAMGEYTTLQYTVQDGDWDEAGWWTLHAYVVSPSWTGPGDAVKFELTAEFD